MAQSQLVCMEDGRMGVHVPESKPEFYYSEEQRAAIEELLRNGDGAFKTRLRDDNMKDFLSAREVKVFTSTFRQFESAEEEKQGGSGPEQDADSGVHSTYWPQESDTEVPPLDIGWPSGGMFKGLTRVTVHTHPPREDGPHLKEVVRRLIQGASKVIAIVMDMLTDVQILQDLMDASSRRSVPVYILLDHQGVPHFLDMCSRLQIGSQHLRNIRTRTLRGIGFCLSFGRLPGSLCNKYMLVDGDKVVFGTYSFSWSSARMDRTMITVMTGQVVDFFDQDFRELYAVSEKLDLYKEFHVSPPAAGATGTLPSKAGTKRPPLPATTSRFQVTLGDSRNDQIEVPAHKYYNPKYSLAFGDHIRPAVSLQEPGTKRGTIHRKSPEELEQEKTGVTSSERMERLSPLPAETPSEIFKALKPVAQDRKLTWRRLFKKSSRKPPVNSVANSTCPSATETSQTSETPSKPKGKKVQRTESQQTVNSTQDTQSVKRDKNKCKPS
ncbi:protein FAM83F [Limanda limanda]|uniref:protein FAM83F n=1 Tax=Limanda limanda TaxID=27771 RepID=UPI0029C8953D|nr:protein FAM83F [Limanda limanda]